MTEEVFEILRLQDERLRNIEILLSQSKNVLNMDEVATFTGLSKSYIYKLTCYGKIPYYKQAKHNYFDRGEIEDWLKSNRFQTCDDYNVQVKTDPKYNKKGGKG
jgi:excisionase family DNA binding protein